MVRFEQFGGRKGPVPAMLLMLVFSGACFAEVSVEFISSIGYPTGWGRTLGTNNDALTNTNDNGRQLVWCTGGSGNSIGKIDLSCAATTPETTAFTVYYGSANDLSNPGDPTGLGSQQPYEFKSGDAGGASKNLIRTRGGNSSRLDRITSNTWNARQAVRSEKNFSNNRCLIVNPCGGRRDNSSYALVEDTGVGICSDAAGTIPTTLASMCGGACLDYKTSACDTLAGQVIEHGSYRVFRTGAPTSISTPHSLWLLLGGSGLLAAMVGCLRRRSR